MDTGTYVIRSLREDEWELYKTLRLKALATHPSLFMLKHFDEARKDIADWKRETCPEGGTVLGLFLGDTLAGMTILLKGNSLATQGMAISTGSYVEPEYRNSKLFVALGEALLAWSEESGFDGIVGSHRDGNKPIEKMMQNYGFTRTGQKPALWADGQTADEVMYSKYFDLTKSAREHKL